MAGTNGDGARSSREAIFISGAGAGIGRKTAELFASKGWFVGLYDVDVEAVAKAREEIGPEKCVDGPLGVTRPAQGERALRAFWAASGQRLDVLFNNAGIIAAGPFAEVDIKRHQ